MASLSAPGDFRSRWSMVEMRVCSFWESCMGGEVNV